MSVWPPIVSALFGWADKLETDGCAQHVSKAALFTLRIEGFAVVDECRRSRDELDDGPLTVGSWIADIVVEFESLRIDAFAWLNPLSPNFCFSSSARM